MSDFDDHTPQTDAAPENEKIDSGHSEGTAPGDELSRAGRVGDFAGFQNGSPDAAGAAPLIAPAVQPAVARAPRSLFVARIFQALWFGSGVFVAFAAIAVFRVLAPTDAADAVGAMLSRWHYVALLAPAILIIIEWRRSRTRMVMILFVAVILAVLQGFTDLKIRKMRADSVLPISSLDRSDPVRRRFGALHGLSSVLLLAQIAAAAAAIAAEPTED